MHYDTLHKNWKNRIPVRSGIFPRGYIQGIFFAVTIVPGPVVLNFCPGIGAEWERPHLGLEGDIVQYLQGILGNTVTERGKLLVQRPGKELGEELKNHQKPDKNDQEIKNDAENHDKQSPDPGIYIFQVFFNVHIPSSLSNDVNEKKHKKIITTPAAKICLILKLINGHARICYY